MGASELAGQRLEPSTKFTRKKMVWCVILAGFAALQSTVAPVSEISFLQMPLPRIVAESSLIVVAHLSRPDSELREFESNVTDTSGEIVSFTFGAQIWHFTVLEVLKAAPDAAPIDEIEVVDTKLHKDYLSAYEAHQSGTGFGQTIYSNRTSYVRNINELGDRDAILFLGDRLEPEFYSHEPYFKAAGKAYPFVSDPGMDDPKLKETILGYIQ